MACIVASDGPDLRAALGASPFVRADLEILFAADAAGLLDAVDRRAALAIVASDGPGDPLAATRTLRERKTPVLLLARAPLDHALVRQIGAAGASETLCPPLDAEDLYEHVAQQLDLPHRRSRRVRVKLHLSLRAGGVEVPGEVHNLSPGGMCVVARTELEIGTAVTLLVEDSRTGQPIEVPARVAWTQPAEELQTRIGLEFQVVRPDLRGLVSSLALFDAEPGQSGVLEVSVHGEIDENTLFAPLAARLEGAQAIQLDTSGVERMNSAGVRGWCNFMGKLRVEHVTFRRCSPAFTIQISMVENLVGGGRVLSVRAPYVCEKCEKEAVRLIDVAGYTRSVQVAVPEFPCPCGGSLVLDDLPERYFAFLRQ